MEGALVGDASCQENEYPVCRRQLFRDRKCATCSKLLRFIREIGYPRCGDMRWSLFFRASVLCSIAIVVVLVGRLDIKSVG